MRYQIFSIVLCFCLMAPACLAADLDAKVIDLFGDNIATIEFSRSHGLRQGDRIDLTYMAGVLPMAIGVYEVSTVKDQVVIARPVSLNMPPDKGMNIQVDKLAKGPAGPEGGKATAPGSQSSYMEITGEVLKVTGDDIRVALKDNGTPGIGWPVDLFYVTSQGKDLPVGQWKVVSVEGQVVVAQKVKGVGNARPGLKAVIHNGPKPETGKRGISTGPTGVGSVEDHMSEPGVFRDVAPQKGSSIELLGESPVSGNDPVTEAAYPFFLGNENAAVTVTEFSNFQCGYSRKFHPKALAVMKPYFDSIKYVFRPFPLLHRSGSAMLSRAAYAAGEQGKFWEMADALFASKSKVGEKGLISLARRVGLNVSQLQRDMADKAARWDALLQQSADLANQWDLTGTPSYYINGKQVPHQDLAEFRIALEKAIKASHNSLRKYRLGVELQKSTDASRSLFEDVPMGAVVVNVFPGSAAQKAGLKPGDIILAVNGQPVAAPRELVNMIASAASRRAVLKVKRGKAVVHKTVRLDVAR